MSCLNSAWYDWTPQQHFIFFHTLCLYFLWGGLSQNNTHTHAHTHTQACIHAHVHTCTHALRTVAHVHKYTHTHKHSRNYTSHTYFGLLENESKDGIFQLYPIVFSRSLDVSGCKAVTDAGVQCVALCCRGLQMVDLSSTSTGNRGWSTWHLYPYLCVYFDALSIYFHGSFAPVRPESPFLVEVLFSVTG